MPEIVIRQIDAETQPGLANDAVMLVARYLLEVMDEDPSTRLAEIENTHRDMFNRGANSFGLFVDSALCGVISTYPSKQTPGYTEVSYLVVHPDVRRQRFGERLLRWVEVQAEAAGSRGMCLDVQGDGAQFFASQGYVLDPYKEAYFELTLPRAD